MRGVYCGCSNKKRTSMAAELAAADRPVTRSGNVRRSAEGMVCQQRPSGRNRLASGAGGASGQQEDGGEMEWEDGPAAGTRRRSSGGGRPGSIGGSGGGPASLGGGGQRRRDSLEPPSSALYLVRGRTCTVVGSCLQDDPADCLAVCVRSFTGLEVSDVGWGWVYRFLERRGRRHSRGQHVLPCAMLTTTNWLCLLSLPHPAPCLATFSLQRWFYCNATTRCGAIFEMYCARLGISLGAVKFLLRGERVFGATTPEDLEVGRVQQYPPYGGGGRQVGCCAAQACELSVWWSGSRLHIRCGSLHTPPQHPARATPCLPRSLLPAPQMRDGEELTAVPDSSDQRQQARELGPLYAAVFGKQAAAAAAGVDSLAQMLRR